MRRHRACIRSRGRCLVRSMEGLGLGGKEWTGGQATSGFRCIGKALLGWAGLDADETKQARRDEKQDDGDYDEKDELEKHDKDGAKVGRAEKQLVDDCGDQAGDYKPKRNSLIQRAAGQTSHDSGEETDDPTGSLGTQPGGASLRGSTPRSRTPAMTNAANAIKVVPHRGGHFVRVTASRRTKPDRCLDLRLRRWQRPPTGRRALQPQALGLSPCCRRPFD